MANKQLSFYDAMNSMLGMGNPVGMDRRIRQQFLYDLFPNGNPALGGGGGSSNTGSNPGNGTPTPNPAAQPLNWSFPQYSQTWAFTPPTPQPVMPPPAFSSSSKTGYATQPKTSTKKPSSAPWGSTPQQSTGGAFSFANLFNKYGR